ncbi:small, acid-soluble spore protein, alpha/beta type [Fictibacillus nanhaiensis]|uniref:small, acid-soluble spore protein, alpha/beta type n=1 Tax=Fictibacillus nanhaiensis TaxID=742169 RepID=UPI001C98093F|nr:small, acid-soluble spore protein, alpha/beta type [Fictibacillus nanhaiensis]MBY6036109.1 small, acid-soluble spore protein, alpha/beta type [Fictibacillus nanhaiensis]
MPRNKLVVKQSEQLVNQFKEEMAEEFGIYRSVGEKEAITPKLIKEQQNGKKK